MSKSNTEVPVLKLYETHADAVHSDNDAMTMLRIWSLLTGAAGLRDVTVGNRHLP